MEVLPNYAKEWSWANCSHRSLQKSDVNDLLFRSQKMSDWHKKICKERRKRFALFHEQIAILLTKNELLARKTKEKIPNPVHKYCIQLKFYATPSFFKKHNTMYRTKRGKPIIHNASPCSPVYSVAAVYST